MSDAPVAHVTVKVDLRRPRPQTEFEEVYDENVRIRMQVVADRFGREMERRMNQILAESESVHGG